MSLTKWLVGSLLALGELGDTYFVLALRVWLSVLDCNC